MATPPVQDMTRAEAVASLREICHTIGCSGMSPSMCQYNPHLCSIIRNIVGTKPVQKTSAS